VRENMRAKEAKKENKEKGTESKKYKKRTSGNGMERKIRGGILRTKREKKYQK
jgi:hypothetical protein